MFLWTSKKGFDFRLYSTVFRFEDSFSFLKILFNFCLNPFFAAAQTALPLSSRCSDSFARFFPPLSCLFLDGTSPLWLQFLRRATRSGCSLLFTEYVLETEEEERYGVASLRSPWSQIVRLDYQPDWNSLVKRGGGERQRVLLFIHIDILMDNDTFSLKIIGPSSKPIELLSPAWTVNAVHTCWCLWAVHDSPIVSYHSFATIY